MTASKPKQWRGDVPARWVIAAGLVELHYRHYLAATDPDIREYHAAEGGALAVELAMEIHDAHCRARGLQP